MLWAAVAAQSQAWLARHQVVARDAVLLLPFAALLAPARAAFAALGGWQPRIETPLTLAATLGPAVSPLPGQCSGDVVLDRLNAGNLLRRMPWGTDWAVRDPAGFAQGTAALVQAVLGLREAAGAHAPVQRDLFWDGLRQRLGGTSSADSSASLSASPRANASPNTGAPFGPASTETLLLRVAVEWAAAAAPPLTDPCFLLQPKAWIVLRMGGPEPLSEALMAQPEALALHLWADADDANPFGPMVVGALPSTDLQRLCCDDFEAEAQATAEVVIQALNAGRAPVALVTLDRELVRRVRALLARADVPLTDETGWLLATTPAAAKLVALLKAAAPQAGPDTWLEWLKTWPPARAAQWQGAALLDSLEAHWREARHVPALAAAQALWARAQAHLRPLAAAGLLPLQQWLRLLHDSLSSDGSLDGLLSDAAGSQVVAAVFRSDAQPGVEAGASNLASFASGDELSAWQSATQDLRLDLGGFTDWVQGCLEQTPYLPIPDADAELVLTPLARCFGRPFQTVVVPGADHQHLGASELPASLVADSLASTLGMDTLATRRLRQRHALAQLLRAPHVTLLRRLRDAEEPLSESPDVQWLLLARAQWLVGLQQGAAAAKSLGNGAAVPLPSPLQSPNTWPLQAWSPSLQTVPAAPVLRPLPVAVGALPQTLSATLVTTLRQCPYRFFAKAVLRLEDLEELDTGLAKRDYGNWLHGVLFRFHQARDRRQPDAPQLQSAADAETRAQGLDAGELLPFRTSFEHFVPAYLAWLTEREAQGWCWHEGETDHQMQPPALQGLRLRGRIDRIDHGPKSGVQVLDYKTGRASALRTQLRDPEEDTQLAFYAALLMDWHGGEATPDALTAAYLALDDADAPEEIAHPQVQQTARALVAGLADEWPRLQAGAAMPALGEGKVCDHCEARGLCRRDHWAAPSSPSDSEPGA
jgi:ATP-dependent helicase/nuclease subunit B